MKISQTLKGGKPNISCELFPPKAGEQLPDAKRVVAEIAALKPDFMSITYGAGGGTSDFTVSLVDEAQNKLGIPALAHLTCASSEKEKIVRTVNQLKEKGIENILALRGDIPADAQFPLPDQYRHACELIEHIKQLGDFCIAGACYPEGHPESGSLEDDLDNIKLKVQTGCDFLITQMFFDNNILYSYLYKMLRKGIDVPVVAGIMPVVNGKQIKRITGLSGSILPPRFKAIVDRFGDDPPAMKQAGIAYATEQIIDLIANGVNNIHIYTMNKPDIAEAIFRNLSLIIR